MVSQRTSAFILTRFFPNILLIPFRRDFPLKFNEIEPTPLDIVESVDMLRVMEYSYRFEMVLTEHDTYSVDTGNYLQRVDKLM